MSAETPANDDAHTEVRLVTVEEEVQEMVAHVGALQQHENTLTAVENACVEMRGVQKAVGATLTQGEEMARALLTTLDTLRGALEDIDARKNAA